MGQLPSEQDELPPPPPPTANAERAFLQHLHDIGWRTADKWMDEHFEDLGIRSTWKPLFVLEESLKPAHLPEDVERSHSE